MPDCLKRIVICDLYDKAGNVIASGRNSCSPDNGICPRLNTISSKENYPPDQCRSLHAEAVALNNIKGNAKPYRSVITGHTFYCNTCEIVLRQAGVEVFEIHTE